MKYTLIALTILVVSMGCKTNQVNSSEGNDKIDLVEMEYPSITGDSIHTSSVKSDDTEGLAESRSRCGIQRVSCGSISIPDTTGMTYIGKTKNWRTPFREPFFFSFNMHGKEINKSNEEFIWLDDANIHGHNWTCVAQSTSGGSKCGKYRLFTAKRDKVDFEVVYRVDWKKIIGTFKVYKISNNAYYLSTRSHFRNKEWSVIVFK